MGCKFTKVRDGRSRDDDGKISEVISQSSSFTDPKKDLECHNAPVTREIVEKCQLAISEINSEEDEVLSPHMYPPFYMDGNSDSGTVATESEMDINFFEGEESRPGTSFSDVSSLSVQSHYPSTISSRLSNFFQMGKRSRVPTHGDVSVDEDNGGGDGNEEDTSSGCERSPTPRHTDTRSNSVLLQRDNTTLPNRSKMAAYRRGGHGHQTTDNILEKDEMPDLDIEDDGRPSSSSSEDSVLPPQINCRVVVRSNAARGTRNVVQAAPDPAEIAHHIVEFEAEVEQLIGSHAVATRDYRNRQLRPRGARGPRLPSFSLQFQNPRSNSRTMVESERRYSKHFAESVSRPQLTVRGLTATNDCLTQWMVSQ
ncbi:uncharacterized protein LOC132543229 [Ylistrum balloti]|uniref:uncharacterized protein LOC132543229 n=1 Tax=Ylistrum balloti TaxID=509963 RepID=UPI0029058D98|nr:uncharacterized protein LOC132543229 [Ylistrum balloti]